MYSFFSLRRRRSTRSNANPLNATEQTLPSTKQIETVGSEKENKSGKSVVSFSRRRAALILERKAERRTGADGALLAPERGKKPRRRQRKARRQERE